MVHLHRAGQRTKETHGGGEYACASMALREVFHIRERETRLGYELLTSDQLLNVTHVCVPRCARLAQNLHNDPRTTSRGNLITQLTTVRTVGAAVLTMAIAGWGSNQRENRICATASFSTRDD
jgi:hypothetical protein